GRRHTGAGPNGRRGRAEPSRPPPKAPDRTGTSEWLAFSLRQPVRRRAALRTGAPRTRSSQPRPAVAAGLVPGPAPAGSRRTAPSALAAPEPRPAPKDRTDVPVAGPGNARSSS